MKKSNLLKGLVGIGALAVAAPIILTGTSCGGEAPFVDKGEIPVGSLTVDGTGALMLANPEEDVADYTILKVPNKIGDKTVSSIAASAFIKCIHLQVINFNEAKSCTKIGASAFAGKYTETIRIDFAAVTIIEQSAFTGLKFQDLDLKNVSDVGSTAFFNCETNLIKIGQLSTWKFDSFYFLKDFSIEATGSTKYTVLNTLDSDGKTVIGQTIYPTQPDVNTHLSGLGWGTLNMDQTPANADLIITANFFSYSRITKITSEAATGLATNSISFMQQLKEINFPNLTKIDTNAITKNPILEIANIGKPKTLAATIISECKGLGSIQTTYLENPATYITSITNTSFSSASIQGVWENKYDVDGNSSSGQVMDYFKSKGGLNTLWSIKKFDLSVINVNRSMKITNKDEYFYVFTPGKVNKDEWTNEREQMVNNIRADIATITGFSLEIVKNNITVTTPDYVDQWAGTAWADKQTHYIYVSATKDSPFLTGSTAKVSVMLSAQSNQCGIPASFFTVDAAKKLTLNPNIVISKAHNLFKMPDYSSALPYETLDQDVATQESSKAFTWFSGPETKPTKDITITNGTFKYFLNLIYVDIKNIKAIEGFAFDGCTKIEQVKIDAVLSSLGQSAFNSSALGTITIDDDNATFKQVQTNADDTGDRPGGVSIGYKSGKTVPTKYSGLGYGGLLITNEIVSLLSDGSYQKLDSGAFWKANSLVWLGDEGNVTKIETTSIQANEKLSVIRLAACAKCNSYAFFGLPELTTLTLGAVSFPNGKIIEQCLKLNSMTFDYTSLPSITTGVVLFADLPDTGKITNKQSSLTEALVNLLKKYGLPSGWTNA